MGGSTAAVQTRDTDVGESRKKMAEIVRQGLRLGFAAERGKCATIHAFSTIFLRLTCFLSFFVRPEAIPVCFSSTCCFLSVQQ